MSLILDDNGNPLPEKYQVWTKTLIWNDIEITVKYNESRCGLRGSLHHIELETKDKQILPVTNTGYRSHFVNDFAVEHQGGAMNYVKNWLDERAEDKEWQLHVEALKQPDLFGELL